MTGDQTLPSPRSTTHYELITEQSELDDLIQRASNAPVVMLDTEFERTSTFYAKPGLLQIGIQGEAYLVDPLSNLNFDSFKGLLENPAIRKVMHAFGEDIELFRHWLGAEPTEVFDTQLAAAFLGYGQSIGYANLCHQLLNIELDKSATRSNWLARPLSTHQLNYAANDVLYLEEIYYLISNQLSDTTFQPMVAEESDRLIQQIVRTENPLEYYLKIRGAWRFSVEQQIRLQSLASWREKTVKALDMPRPHLLPDKALINLVEEAPEDLKALKRVLQGYSRSFRQFGAEILARLITPVAVDSEFLEISPPLTTFWQNVLKGVKKGIASVAKSNKLPKEVLISSKQLESLILLSQREGVLTATPFYSGWRWALVEPVLRREVLPNL